jgi:hypothetical protein
MKKAIDYEALSTRLYKAIKIAKKLGLQVIPGGGYSMDASFRKVPTYPVGLFGALSIVEGQEARGKLGLTYLQTAALEAGFNSVEYPGGSMRPAQSKRIKKDDEYLKLEALGKELAKKLIPITLKTIFPDKKKKRQLGATYQRYINSNRPMPAPWQADPPQVAVNAAPEAIGWNDMPAPRTGLRAIDALFVEAPRAGTGELRTGRWESTPRYISGPQIQELQIRFDDNDDDIDD